MLRRLEEFLGAHAAKYERLAHQEAFTAPEEAAAAHVSGWSWAKVVIVKEREGFAMAVLPACCAIDMDRLKGLIGLGEIELASVEEILQTFPGCELGAIPPFGRLFGVPAGGLRQPARHHDARRRSPQRDPDARDRVSPSDRTPARAVCRARG